jgi:hypothetical protein
MTIVQTSASVLPASPERCDEGSIAAAREHNSYANSINTDDNLSCCFEIDTNHSI